MTPVHSSFAWPQLVLVIAATFLATLALAAEPDPDPDQSPIWIKVKQSLFENRAIEAAHDDMLSLETPWRAEDAATVPLAIKSHVTQTLEKYIQRIYLIIDKNPSPIAAIFDLTTESGRADIDTRVRIEEYTHIRAIAEMNDGKLYMVVRYIRASGGCSAPAGKDQEAALARLGKIKFRLENEIALNRPTLAQLMISHPNNSGLQMDQLTRLYIPPRYVKKIDVTYNDKRVLSADVDFSISENPNFRFYFTPHGPGELKAQVIDSNELQFSNHIEIRPGLATGN
jgi:sulfur-oxidizing protein SoxY